MRGDRHGVHHDESCRKRMTEVLRTTDSGRKRMEGAEERVDRFFEKLGEKMDDYGEKEAKRMRKERQFKVEQLCSGEQ